MRSHSSGQTGGEKALGEDVGCEAGVGQNQLDLDGNSAVDGCAKAEESHVEVRALVEPALDQRAEHEQPATMATGYCIGSSKPRDSGCAQGLEAAGAEGIEGRVGGAYGHCRIKETT
jgi:hypothetical protein